MIDDGAPQGAENRMRGPVDMGRRGLLRGMALGAVASGVAAAGDARAADPHAGEVRPGGPFLVAFTAGNLGPWRIDSVRAVTGDGLPSAARLAVREHAAAEETVEGFWTLRGTTSNTRYTDVNEAKAMAAKQQGLGRPASTRAALIPIRKSPAWWALAQDQRRALFEEQSHHIEIGLDYLPGIARRLHHGRELGEPFDFLTWFEYAPEDSAAFETLVQRLRATEEWKYVDREVDIRLSRA